MTLPQSLIHKQWQQLTQKIRHHDLLYYQKDAPEISDVEYDGLRRQLEDLEKTYPSLLIPQSPTQQVGFIPAFSKVGHVSPLYSLNNAFNEKELDQFIQRTHKFLSFDEPLTWVAEPKIDGLTVVLRYLEGHLVRGATRGDGENGEDITANVKTISSIPRVLKSKIPPQIIEIRGEVYIMTDDFIRLNKEREDDGLNTFANPRNAAAGSLRQLDPEITKQRPLLFIAHGSSIDIGKTYGETMAALQSWGIPYQPLAKMCYTTKDLLTYFKDLEERRDFLKYEIDGVVYKIDDLQLQQRLGYSARAPRYAVAYKFHAAQEVSVIDGIDIQVGRTGVLTPVANLRPVHLAGVVISRATLHNEDEIQRKDIRVGDTVVIQRAGDVIPQVVRVIKEKRPSNSSIFIFPDKCPVCHASVIRLADEVARRCTGGTNCPAQVIWRLRHFASRDAFDIDGLGIRQVTFLYEKGLIKSLPDIFYLGVQDLENLEGWGTKSAENLIQAIDSRKNIPLHRFIYSLGIPQVGEFTAKLLAKHYESILFWINEMQKAYDQMSSAFQDLISIDGIGPTIAIELVTFIHHNKGLIDDLLLCVNVTTIKAQASSILSGKSIVFTGSLDRMTRAEAKQKAEELGARVLNAVSKDTDYVVAGDSPGSKIKNAKELTVTILTQEQWEEMLK